MKQNKSSQRAVPPSDSPHSEPAAAPGFYKVLCLGLLAMTVLLSLFKLSQAFQGDPNVASNVSATRSATALGLNRLDSGTRDFQSQRRPVAAAVDASPADPVTESEQRRPVKGALRSLEEALAVADQADQSTATALRRFTKTGSMAELREITREDIESLASYLTQSMSTEDLSALLEQYLGLPASRAAGQPNLRETLVGIYDAVAGNRREDVRPSALTITDECLPDGRVTGQTHMLPTGTSTVYAVFENDRGLSGLDQVLAVWRNPDDEKMVFTEFEPIREGSAYNYVWLNVKEGWPSGRYQVELYHPEAQSLLLASESFSVR